MIRSASVRATASPIRSTRISSPHSRMACRRAPASRSGSTAWSCWRAAPRTSRMCCGHPSREALPRAPGAGLEVVVLLDPVAIEDVVDLVRDRGRVARRGMGDEADPRRLLDREAPRALGAIAAALGAVDADTRRLMIVDHVVAERGVAVLAADANRRAVLG